MLEFRYLWVLALLSVIIVHLLFPYDWWITTTFSLLGSLFLVRSVGRIIEFYHIQRRINTLLFGVSYAFFSAAFFMGSLLTASHPIFDFTFTRTPALVMWGIGLAFYAVSVTLELQWLYRKLKESRTKN